MKWVNMESRRKLRRYCSNPHNIYYPNKIRGFWEEVDARGDNERPQRLNCGGEDTENYL